jgi:hypothetical protein
VAVETAAFFFSPTPFPAVCEARQSKTACHTLKIHPSDTCGSFISISGKEFLMCLVQCDFLDRLTQTDVSISTGSDPEPFGPSLAILD